MRNSFIYTLIISACLVALSACGQKGPLFVPEDPEAQAAEAAEAAEAAQNLNDEETQKKKPEAAE